MIKKIKKNKLKMSDYEDDDYENNDDEDEFFDSSDEKEEEDDENEEGSEKEGIEDEEEDIEELTPSMDKNNNINNNKFSRYEESCVITELANDYENGYRFTEEEELYLGIHKSTEDPENGIFNETRSEYVARKWFFGRKYVPFTKIIIRKSPYGDVKVSTDDLEIIER